MTAKLSGWGLVLLAALALGVPGAGGRAFVTTTVVVQVIGGGQVTGGGGQVACGAGGKSCYATYVTTGSISLTESAPVGWAFSSWSGCSATTTTTCTVTLNGDSEVTATFNPTGAPPGSSTLTVNVSLDTAGRGGTVKGNDITCGSEGGACQATETTGSTLTVLEIPDTGYAFSAWGGDCSGSSKSCTVSLDSDQSVNASFVASATTFTLTVSVTGNGTITGGGISCTSAGGAGCTADETAGSAVTLSATPGSGASFTGWGGACAGTLTTCTLTMDAAKSVTAAFSGSGGTGATFRLSVSVSGSGTVTGGGIDCGNGATTCSANVAANSSVTLTAEPAAGATFGGWGEACSGTAKTCTVRMTAAKSVSATFSTTTPGRATLTLNVTGRGAVSGAGPSCAGSGGTTTCRHSYAVGESVALTAVAQPGARFLGWSGACAGTVTTCSVTMTGPKTVTATFSGAGAALLSRGRPDVRRAKGGFQVTLRFRSGLRGLAHVRAIRAGRVETGLSFTVAAGPGTIGPLLVQKPGYYTFELQLGAHAVDWRACLGRCGAGAPGGPFTVRREPAAVVRAGEAWSVTIHFRSNRPAGAELRILRGRKAVRHLRFAPPAGEISSGPFVVTPGTYTLRLTVTDAYGRTRLLTWFAFLPA